MQIAELVRRGYKLTLFDRNPHKKNNNKKKRIGQLNSTKLFEKWALFPIGYVFTFDFETILLYLVFFVILKNFFVFGEKVGI